MYTYNHILQGHEATKENAYNHARGIDWMSVDKTYNDKLPYLDYIDTVNGIDIWYCYGADIYLFSDELDE